MLRKLKFLALGVLLLLLVVSICINITLIKSGYALSRVLSEKGTVILSPSQTEMLYSDLKSTGGARMEQWRSYLDQFRSNANNNLPATELNETLKLYASKEKPGRSNYFNRMVFQLWMAQQSKPWSKQEVLNFLGKPDIASNSLGRQELTYGYSSDGIDYLALFVASNETVVDMQICEKPR